MMDGRTWRCKDFELFDPEELVGYDVSNFLRDPWWFDRYFAIRRLTTWEEWNGHWEPPTVEVNIVEEIIVRPMMKCWGKGL